MSATRRPPSSPDELRRIRKYRAQTGCTLREAADYVMGGHEAPPDPVEPYRAILRRFVANGHASQCSTNLGYPCDCGWKEARDLVGEETDDE